MDNFKILKNILSYHLDVSKISINDKLADIGVDSLDLVEALIEVEKAFNIRFKSSEISNIVYVKDVLDLIDQKKK